MHPVSYTYQPSSHTGNVRVTFARDAAGQPEMLSHKDYYPYGMPMPGRQLNPANHRYGYQGEFAEKDRETGFNNFYYRQYDSRIGRWTTTDPYHQFFSPYIGMGNNPILYSDPSGGAVGGGSWHYSNDKLWVKLEGRRITIAYAYYFYCTGITASGWPGGSSGGNYGYSYGSNYSTSPTKGSYSGGGPDDPPTLSGSYGVEGKIKQTEFKVNYQLIPPEMPDGANFTTPVDALDVAPVLPIEEIQTGALAPQMEVINSSFEQMLAENNFELFMEIENDNSTLEVAQSQGGNSSNVRANNLYVDPLSTIVTYIGSGAAIIYNAAKWAEKSVAPIIGIHYGFKGAKYPIGIRLLGTVGMAGDAFSLGGAFFNIAQTGWTTQNTVN